ncbi:MAG TPA: class II fructose-bisphosphate aldolase [Actinobacteria bacterium]|jgi:fructose-bisphosphate aldolase class II|nr:class II fructose-bisphosphate aldolase [Actinomycetota bacterium]
MTYVNTVKMLQDTMHKNYVVGAFNIIDVTTMKAAIDAAIAKKSPLIIQTSQKTILQLGYKVLSNTAKFLADEAGVDVAMMLDHGTDPEIIRNCINNGWSAVMVDGSSKPFEENIRFTREIVEIAHENNVSVEGELGHIGGVEEHIIVDDGNVQLTDPDKILEFKELSGVDSLAVAIGTQHGLYKGKVTLDFDRLEKIMKIAVFPIVIHGGSDLPEEDFKRIVSLNPAKMNISTEIKHAYLDGFKEYINSSGNEYEPIKAIGIAYENTKKLIMNYMDRFGSTNKCLRDRGFK